MGKLGILEKILPPENKIFFDCFIDSAVNCREMAKLFYETVSDGGINDDRIIRAKTLKHRGSSLERETIAKLNSSFITPIDSEDIQLLANVLNKITKKIAQAFMNLRVYRVNNFTEEMVQQSKIILSATEELQNGVKLLKTIHKVKEITLSQNAMKEIEVFGDEVLYKAMDKLFSGDFDAVDVIKFRDIYKDLESALDKCYTVSDVILTIALKNN